MQSLQASEQTATISSSQHPARRLVQTPGHSSIGIALLLVISVSGCSLDSLHKVKDGVDTIGGIIEGTKKVVRLTAAVGEIIGRIEQAIQAAGKLIRPSERENLSSCVDSNLMACRVEEMENKLKALGEVIDEINKLSNDLKHIIDLAK